MKKIALVVLALALLSGCASNATPEQNRERAADFWQSGDFQFHS